MHVIIVDINDEVLDGAVKSVKAVDGVGEVWGLKVDVSRIDEVVAMREKVFDEFGEVSQPHDFETGSETDGLGTCIDGKRWYREDNTSHVNADSPCGATDQLVRSPPDKSIWGHQYRSGFCPLYGPAGEPQCDHQHR